MHLSITQLMSPVKSLVSALIYLFLSFLKALSDIQIAVKMVKSNEDGDENPLDRQYRSLHCSLQPLDSSSHEYRVCSNHSLF